MYLVRVDNGNTAKVSLCDFGISKRAAAYRVSLSDMLATVQVV